MAFMETKVDYEILVLEIWAWMARLKLLEKVPDTTALVPVGVMLRPCEGPTNDQRITAFELLDRWGIAVTPNDV